eukprot:7231-Heterococcus_DN1.PRE.3
MTGAITWGNTVECDNYVTRLQQAADALSLENRKLRKQLATVTAAAADAHTSINTTTTTTTTAAAATALLLYIHEQVHSELSHQVSSLMTVDLLRQRDLWKSKWSAADEVRT